METQRNSDVRATERIFKKVVYPGLETLRVVDRNGVPISYPGFNSVRSKSFILSPRGVPMKTPNHIYSGYHSHQAKVSDLIERPQSPENYYGPEKTFLTQPPLGSNSAKLPRKNNESPLLEKKRATTSQSAVPKHKGASSDHFLTSESPEKRILNSANSNYWNLSNQGLRLQREWTSLSNTRSIKRASEIVNHRVDRMYFMSGNSIKLKPRYDVDEEELSKMKEMQAKNKETAHKRLHVKKPIKFHVAMQPREDYPEDIPEDRPEDITADEQRCDYDGNKENDNERPLSQCRMCDHDVDVRHTVSVETGFQDMDIKDGEINFEVEDPQLEPANNNEHQVSVIEGPVNILDIMSHKDQQLLGKCMLELMKEYPNGAKETKIQSKKLKFVSSGLKKRKPPKRKLNFNEVLYPEEDLNIRNFPTRKQATKKMVQEPVECDCRKAKELDSASLSVEGRKLPVYQYVDWDIIELVTTDTIT